MTPGTAARQLTRLWNAEQLLVQAPDDVVHASPIGDPRPFDPKDLVGPTLPPGTTVGPPPASLEEMIRQQQNPPPAQQLPPAQQPPAQQPPGQQQPAVPQPPRVPEQPSAQQNPQAPGPTTAPPVPAESDAAPGPTPESELPDRVDPSLLPTLAGVGLGYMYNSDGTLKSRAQLANERAARDLMDLPMAMAENTTGVTPLAGGGTLEKTITSTTDGWEVGYNVTLSNGYTTNTTKTGTDVEELGEGRTATTLSFQEAQKQARAELGRVSQQMLTPGQPRPAPGEPASVFASGIEHLGDAEQLVEAVERLTANPNAPITVIKDQNGRIASLSVLGIDGKEHVLVLNAGKDSYDQENKKYFEFYRHPDGAITTPEGYRIVEVGGQFIRVDASGAPVVPDNPFAKDAQVLSNNGVRTNRPHGATLVPSQSLTTPDYGPPQPTTVAPYDGPLRYPVTPAANNSFFVELPSGDNSAVAATSNSHLAAIEEIPVPPGVSATRMYKVQGGGLLVEDAAGLHWATDPGAPPTSDEIGKNIANAIATEIIWIAAGEGLGYVAVRVGAKVLPKMFGRLGGKADEAADGAIVPPAANGAAVTTNTQTAADSAAATRAAAVDPAAAQAATDAAAAATRTTAAETAAARIPAAETKGARTGATESDATVAIESAGTSHGTNRTVQNATSTGSNTGSVVIDSAAPLHAAGIRVGGQPLANDAQAALGRATAEELDQIQHILATRGDDAARLLEQYGLKGRKAVERGESPYFDGVEDVGDRLTTSLANLDEVRRRGYPYLFESRQHFEEVKSGILAMSRKYGVDPQDVRFKVQGGAVHNPNTGDVDVALIVDAETFRKYSEQFIRESTNQKVRKTLLKDAEKGKFTYYRWAPREVGEDVGWGNLVHESLPPGKKIQISIIKEGSGFDFGPYL